MFCKKSKFTKKEKKSSKESAESLLGMHVYNLSHVDVDRLRSNSYLFYLLNPNIKIQI